MNNSRLLLILLMCFSLLSPTLAAATDENILRYGETRRPDTLDPYTSRELSSQRLIELIFNGLVGINSKQEIVPELAKRWEQINDREIIFHLRDDVYWHSKNEQKVQMTADDVVFTVRLINNSKTDSARKSYFSNIKSTKVIDAQTIHFKLKRPSLNAVVKFSFKILPEHILKNTRRLKKSNKFANNPVGTGAYMYKQSSRNREVTLIANPDYFLGEPEIKEIQIKPFDDQNIMNQALSFNALDMVINVNPSNVTELQADKRFVLSPVNTLSYSFFAYNQNNPHLMKRAMRKALSFAINKAEMLRAFYNNQGTIISGPFAPGSWAYNLDVKPDEFNPIKAVSILKQVGYSMRNQRLIDQHGKAVEFSLRVPIEKNNESTKRVILAYSNFLKRIGITIKVNFMEREAWKSAVFSKHDFDITYASWTFDDASDISTLFHSDYNGPWENNFINYSNSEVDALIEASNNTLDYEEKRTINHKLHKLLAHDAPYTFLWSLNQYTAYHQKLKNVSVHSYKYFDNVHQWTIR